MFHMQYASLSGTVQPIQINTVLLHSLLHQPGQITMTSHFRRGLLMSRWARTLRSLRGRQVGFAFKSSTCFVRGPEVLAVSPFNEAGGNWAAHRKVKMVRSQPPTGGGRRGEWRSVHR